MEARSTVAVAERFYAELCNEWRLELADELLADDFRIRVALGATISGREPFKAYLRGLRAAFPDWHHRVDEILAADNRVVVRLTYSGTHRGPLAGIEPTGARVEFVGAAFFRLSENRIDEAWVVGDTQAFWRALGRL